MVFRNRLSENLKLEMGGVTLMKFTVKEENKNVSSFLAKKRRVFHMSEVHNAVRNMDVEIDGALKFILGQSKIVYCYADHF